MKRSRDDSDDDVHEDVISPEKKAKEEPNHVRIGVLTDNPSVYKRVSEQTMTEEDVDIFREDTGLELRGLTFEFFLLDGRTAASRFYILRDTLLGGPGAAIDVIMIDSGIDFEFQSPLEADEEEDLESFLHQFIESGAHWIHVLTYLYSSRAWKNKQFWFVASEYKLDATLFTKGDANSFSLPFYISEATSNSPWPLLMILGEVKIDFTWFSEISKSELKNWLDNGLFEPALRPTNKGKNNKGDDFKDWIDGAPSEQKGLPDLRRMTLSDTKRETTSHRKVRALASEYYKWTPKALAIIRKTSLEPFYRAVFKALVFEDAMRQPPIAKTTRRPDGHRVRESPLSEETEKLVLQYLGGKAKEAPQKKQRKQQKLLLVDSSSDSDSD